MSLWISDPKTGKKSVTLTLLVLGVFVCTAKLALSGITLGGITVETFGGTDFAAVVGALGLLYGSRKYTDAQVEKTKNTFAEDDERGI